MNTDTVAARGIFHENLIDREIVESQVTPHGVVLSFIAQSDATGHMGREIELLVDFHELEAMRCGMAPAKVFVGRFASWVDDNHVSDWRRGEQDGERVWLLDEWSLEIQDVEVRVWLSEAFERGFWKDEVRVQLLCLWRAFDLWLADGIRKLDGKLVTWLRDAKAPAKHPTSPDPLGEAMLVATLGNIAADCFDARGGFEVLEGSLGRERLRQLIVRHRDEDLIPNHAVCRRFWAVANERYQVS